VSLRAPADGVGLTNIVTGQVPGARMRIFPVDWNNDGVMDFLLGNADGTVYYYEGYQFAFTHITTQAGGTLLLQWNSAPYLEYNVLTNGYPTNIQYLAATNLPSGGKTTSWSGTHNEDGQFFHVQIAP
jgi:hypothetical protein